VVTLDELYNKLLQYNDVESAVAIYRDALDMEKKFAELKKLAANRVETHLRETGEAKGKTSFGVTYGWTNPKPVQKLNDELWTNAVISNPDLQLLVSELEWKQKQLEEKQKPFIEEIPGTSRLYIK